jgi:peptide-methionine (S)-S-oxide reductase
MTMTSKTATFGAGCFWGVEARFRELPGVTDVAVGYMGGETENPSYRDVCGGHTGHAEVAQVRYDGEHLDYQVLLDLFFEIHDPTTRNRQGPDIGSQYRSVIFAHDDQQLEMARATLDRLGVEGRYKRPIVTDLVPAGAFWRAEEYHQRYLEKNSSAHCHI